MIAIEAAAPDDPLPTARGDPARVEIALDVPVPLGHQVREVGHNLASDRTRIPVEWSLGPAPWRHRDVVLAASVGLGGIDRGETPAEPAQVVVLDAPPRAHLGVAHEARQRGLVAVVPRPPPAHLTLPTSDDLDRQLVLGGQVRALPGGLEARPDEPGVASLMGLAPAAQGHQSEDQVEPADVLPTPGPPPERGQPLTELALEAASRARQPVMAAGDPPLALDEQLVGRDP